VAAAKPFTPLVVVVLDDGPNAETAPGHLHREYGVGGLGLYFLCTFVVDSRRDLRYPLGMARFVVIIAIAKSASAGSMV